MFLNALRCLYLILLLALRRRSGGGGGFHASPSLLYLLHSGASLLPPFFFLRAAGAALDDEPPASSSLRRFAPSKAKRARCLAALSAFLFHPFKPLIDGFCGFAGLDPPVLTASSCAAMSCSYFASAASSIRSPRCCTDALAFCSAIFCLSCSRTSISSVRFFRVSRSPL